MEGLRHIVPVVGTDGVHGGAGGGGRLAGQLLEMIQKVGLERLFVGVVPLQILRKFFVVGEGKGVGGVMHQLAQVVAAQHPQLPLPLQPAAQPLHISLGVAPVVAPEPLLPERALQVGGGVPVRLDTAQQKGPGTPAGLAGQVLVDEVLGQQTVAFSFHWASSLGVATGHYSIRSLERIAKSNFSPIAIKEKLSLPAAS